MPPLSLSDMETVKTTFKLTVDAVADLELIAKILGRTKRKCLDTMLEAFGEMEYYDKPGEYRTFYGLVMESIDYHGKQYSRTTQSMSKFAMGILEETAQDTGRSRDEILDSMIKIFKSLSTGENKTLNMEVLIVTETANRLWKELYNIFDSTILLTWGEALSGDYAQLSISYSNLRVACEELMESISNLKNSNM